MTSNRTIWIRRIIILFCCMTLWAGIALADLIYIGGHQKWSSFDKIRIRAHFEYYSNVSWFLPPIGPLKQIHHMGRLVDAFIDKDFPPNYSMNFMRSLVTDSEDCIKTFQQHENNVQKGKGTKNPDTIRCEVPFGYGAQDTFKIQVFSEKINGTMNTAFFVNGFGLSPISEKQSPMHVLRPLGDFADTIAPAVYSLSNLITHMVKEDLAQVLWINLTDRKETSRYSLSNSRLSIREWVRQTKESNRKGEGFPVQKY